MSEYLKTGIEGLDDVLGGGLPRNRVYLLQGDPGAGKTTVAMQFLLEGTRCGETCLYVTLSETREELAAVARSHGWSIGDVHVHEMGTTADASDVDEEDENTLYTPAEVELGERMRELLAEVERLRPSRIVIDSCTELRLLAQTPLRFRRQILALKKDLIERKCTILVIENPLSAGGDPLLQSLVHGVVILEQLAPLYGAQRRRVRVAKLREVSFRGGYHDMTIVRGGVQVFPRLVAAEHQDPFEPGVVSSGVPQIDKVLGGGIDRGSATLIMGPAGSGKSVLASQYAYAAASRGEHAAMFVFDEAIHTLLARSDSLGQDLAPLIANQQLRVQQVDPAEMSPGEFVHTVHVAVERDAAKVIVIDSLNGYLQSMPEETFLVTQLHELFAYLRQRGVVVFLVLAQSGFIGPIQSLVDVSYLADNVIMTRYFEADGRVRKALSVVKKRSGAHEDTIRELTLGPLGVTVGEPLMQFRGILTGVPELRGQPGWGPRRA